MFHLSCIDEQRNLEEVGFVPSLAEEDLSTLEHWCGVRIWLPVYSRDDLRAVGEAVESYIASLTSDEAERRRSIFQAYREAYLFRADFWRWLAEKVKADDGSREAQQKYLRSREGDVVTAAHFTDAVPLELRKRFAEGKNAIEAWRALLARLNLQLERRTHVTARVVEGNSK